jgi:A/G-specific adenine glycosylase
LNSASFSQRITDWQKRHGRHDLPWQNTRDPYRIWLSEIMLQQTQVATVIPFYHRFLARFPSIVALASATEDQVLTSWSGLGYYSRARNLHAAAKLIVTRHAARFPRTMDDIVALPGIGRSTAAAIAVFAFGQRQAILDANVKRVLARYAGIDGYPGDARIQAELWLKAEALLPRRLIGSYTQGLMDLGALLCARRAPSCLLCPVSEDCVALRDGRVAELPTPKRRGVIPEKHTLMLILEQEGAILLEKRPALGIWGALWSFPEAALDDDVEALCRRRFGAEVERVCELPSLSHGFTHFKLNITPLRCKVVRMQPGVHHPAYLWLAPGDAQKAAIPSPVRRLLQYALAQDGAR